MAFKTSVNIKFDIGNVEFIKRYIPTPSHADAMKGIIEGFTEESVNRSHIIIGPYGTGKSLLANVVGSIVSKSVDRDNVTTLVNKFNQVDEYIAGKINHASNLPTLFLPILLSGNEGRFRQSILTNVLKKLGEQGLDIVLPGLSSKILQSIKVWDDEFPDTYKAFCLRLEQDGKQIVRWLEEIKKQNEVEIKYFSSIYPLLTAGASFEVDYDHSFLSQMEYLATVLKENNMGIFIVYDEFARFLQGLNKSKFNEAMQDIQDLAELSNRLNCIHFILITHKSLRHYFSSSDEDSSKEFQRIEKRFNQYLIKSDQATFLRIAEIIVSENIDSKPQISLDDFTRIQGAMRKYPLFPSINQTERDELVIRGMYPLHPVSIFLLPHLTRVFGQNERTLFTFLESQETGGLINHISKSKEYYLAHQLFDFFFPDSTGNSNDELAEHMLLYKKAIARMPEDIPNKKHTALNLVKVITLWNLCVLQNEQKLTTDFLQFAIGTNEEELLELLSLLNTNKIVRFNRVNGFWELFAGSSIDLQEKLEQEKQSLKQNPTNEIEVLKSNLSRKYYFPEKYNDEKGMTRFAAVKIIYGKEVLEGKIENDTTSDLSLYYVLPENTEVTNALALGSTLRELSVTSRGSLCFIHPDPVENIKSELYNYMALESLRRNKTLLSEDKGIREELEILLNEAKYTISDYLLKISIFDGIHPWYVEGNETYFNSEFELTEKLTDMCNRLYKHTPIILNDSFNRSSISGAQRNAAVLLINKILEEPHNNQFGITGNGPEYALYASIFKNNDRFDYNVNNLDYSTVRNEPFRLLRSKLKELLDKNPKGSLKDLIDIFIAPPFGIRKPLIPILFVSLLRDRWNELMLYSNGMFVPGINGAKLYDIIVEAGPENYHYVYERIDEGYIQLFSNIETHFRDSLEERLSTQSRLIYVCGTLLKWLRSLPKITQTSEHVDEEFKQIRDLIKRSEIDPQQTIAEIYKLFYEDLAKLLKVKEYAEHQIIELKQELISKVNEIIGVGEIGELKSWAEDQRRSLSFNSKMLEKMLNALTSTGTVDERIWIDKFSEEYIGVKIEDWSDTTYELFINQLIYDRNHLNLRENENNSLNKENVVTVQLNNSRKIINKVDLSVKSTTVYSNLERMINTAGKNVPRQEMEYLIYRLFETYVVKAE
ncbi:hypothetical protein PM3016_6701 [Paenibacillus mucilaginosus 3016]|uniref:Uncharacterized protein n=1 Tax=Paenibacillus mucilaginosus 3016 TaxID=1116391 RepID=H6NNI8_9BACL|nr:hypothetical protein [Paenibacillus mucilaginosus]AFC33309.1 hypothetical protein PM3016_6701 [Paenibacillus mucilaginosus 3016]WFA21726.1 hypothetical protein ERY13_33270 [Paenibacillus mucilaginosus]